MIHDVFLVLRWSPTGSGTAVVVRFGAGLDCAGRAEMDAPAAEFAVVFPDRLSLHQFNIFCRADGCTDPARRAVVIDGEFLVIVMHMGSKTRVHQGMHEACKESRG